MKQQVIYTATWISVCVLGFANISCTQMQRSKQSGYSSSKDYPTTRRSSQTINHEMQQVEPENISEKARLKKLENALNVKKEVEQYSKALPWFYSDSERVEFLSLPGFEARSKWLSQQNFNGRSSLVLAEFQDLVEAKDIALRMPMTLVRQSWGDPDGVEVSGNPQFKNERWKYNKYVSTPDGYKSEKKSVYFEGGKVVGWEVE